MRDAVTMGFGGSPAAEGRGEASGEVVVDASMVGVNNARVFSSAISLDSAAAA
jgi:hypothetical protein